MVTLKISGFCCLLYQVTFRVLLVLSGVIGELSVVEY